MVVPGLVAGEASGAIAENHAVGELDAAVGYYRLLRAAPGVVREVVHLHDFFMRPHLGVATGAIAPRAQNFLSLSRHMRFILLNVLVVILMTGEK